MTTIEVKSATAPYRVVIAPGARHELPALVGDAARVAVLHPPAMARQVASLVDGISAEVVLIEVPDSEQAKSSQVLISCWDRLAEAGFTRSDLVVGFGGGSTTDLAGFVAASWLRGVALITVPTTVLGMVDAAVGGKTGINIAAGKNLVGAFHEPQAVLCDLDLLITLPEPEIRSGMAEVIKCGFIADQKILDLAEASPATMLDVTSAEAAEAITRGVAVKAEVVASDLREATSQGSAVGREKLNYGHTLGHAIERHTGYRMRHGEAISVGMVFVAELARLDGRLSDDEVVRHRDLLGSVGLPTTYSAQAWPDLRAAMALDKKTRGSQLRFVVLDAIGTPAILSGPSEELLTGAYAALA